MMYEKIDLDYPNVRKGYYEIDTDGNIYVKKTGEIRKTAVHNGYVYLKCVGISKKYVDVSLHRALGYAFLNLTQDKEINHINGDGTDNRLDNLEVVTHQENIKHSIDSNLAPKGERHVNSKYTDNTVHLICECFEKGYNNTQTFEIVFGEVYDSYNSNHKKHLTFIGRVRRGDRWQHISSEYNFQKKVYGTSMHRNK